MSACESAIGYSRTGKCGINAGARHEGKAPNDHCDSFDYYYTAITWHREGTRNAWSQEVDKALDTLSTSTKLQKNQKPNVKSLSLSWKYIIKVLTRNLGFPKKKKTKLDRKSVV